MTDTTIIILGEEPGLGMALARRFGRKGHRIVLLGRDAARLDDLRAALATEDIEAVARPADAGRFDELGATLEDIAAGFGPPACLIHNAAVLRPTPLHSLTPEHLVEEFRVDVASALAAAHAVMPAMTRAGRGTVLLTGSGFAFDPLPEMAALGVGKAGLRNLALSLAKDLEPEGIHVATVTICGVIAPGTAFAPDSIADIYWDLHAERPGAWTRERILTG